MKFRLPYIIHGNPAEKKFVNVAASTITAAAAKAEEYLRNKFSAELGKRVCVAVGEIDYSNRDINGNVIQPQPVYRRKRRYYGRRNRYGYA